jgi:uncharacterized protein (DUF433 family)
MASGIEIDTLIDRDPAIRGGRPKIAGTGLTVRRIVGWYKMGMTPEEIAFEYPHLALAQMHAGLAYYHANREEIEADIVQEDVAAAHWEHQLANDHNGRRAKSIVSGR